MNIKVLLSFGNLLFSEGISAILDNEEDFSVKILEPGARYDAEQFKTWNPCVILTDFTSLYNAFPEVQEKKLHFILLDTNCGMDNLVSAVLKKKINGILLGNSTSAIMKKAIRAVAKGDIWIDRQTFKNLIIGINALSSDKIGLLSKREKEIVALVGDGFRNKEIAHKLFLSEPTVKSHLNRIFHKLNVRTRSELVGYAIKNNDLGRLAGHESARPKSV